MKAMILAAGRGKRMGDLTDNCPKPLLKVGDNTLIEWQIIRLKNNGFTDIVINVGYLGKQIIDYLGNGHRYGVNIAYSVEPQ
ncbi:MAG: NTP transferase domain-containing protein, partial [Gammaproteobacteria bacterium]|nr:NTP transferase domain-containing protein [Gammaproteobacteria bacterium]